MNPEILPKRRLTPKAVIWVAAVSVISIAVVWSVHFQRASNLHMNVLIQASDSLRIEFLQRSHGTTQQCQALAKRVAETMLAECAICRLLENRCINKLDVRYSNIISGQPVDIPIIRTPVGAVAFISNTPGLADEACRESERLASGKVPVRCVAAGVASTAVSFAKVDRNADAAVMPTIGGTLGLILFAAVMSLVASYLALRSVRSQARLRRYVGAPNVSTSPESNVGALHQYSLLASRGTYEIAKRILDLTLGALLLIASLPIILAAALCIRLETPGNPFFFQIRLGKGGKPFRILKLRGMYIDARSQHPELYDYSKQDSLDFFFHIENDPRITKVGALIRRFSIDELPNVWNVVVGDMSLVGPRPEIPEVLDLYGPYRDKYLSVKPGVTCLSKITGRDRLSKLETIRLDIDYIDRRSQYLDLKILLATFAAVVLRQNVHV